MSAASHVPAMLWADRDAAAAQMSDPACLRARRFSRPDLEAMHRWAGLAAQAGYELVREFDPQTEMPVYVATWAEGDQFVTIRRTPPYAGWSATVQHQGTHVEVFDRLGCPAGRFATLAQALASLWRPEPAATRASRVKRGA